MNGAIPSNDPYETNFIANGERNIFRQAWQRRADISISKITQITERVSLKYKMDVFNLTNTASFDIPIDDVSQNINFNGFPVRRPGWSNYALQHTTSRPFMSARSLSGLGITNKTIGIRGRFKCRCAWFSNGLNRRTGIFSRDQNSQPPYRQSALPMASDAVAAGEGTLSTCSTLPEGTN